MTKYLAVLLTLAVFICISASVPDNAFSQELVQKIGNRCPGHYAPDGNYCKPLSGAKEIITKIGNRCPSGFAPDGDYCYRIQSRPAKVIPKIGNRCPRDYRPDGAYCVTLN